MLDFTMPLFNLATPEIFVLTMASIILLVDVFVPKKFGDFLYYVVLLTLVGAFFLVLQQFNTIDEPVVTFSGGYVVDKLALLTKLFVLVASLFSFLYAKPYITSRHIVQNDYYVLGLFAVLGMMIMASAYSFLTIYLGLELLSLPLYAMVALQKDSQKATEAAMKYFVMGALASALLLYGISMIYGVTKTINIADLGSIINQLSFNDSSVVMLSMIFIVAGLLFKLGAVPFHMWVPDVYDGAPASVTLFIASAPKIAAFCITIRVLVEGMPSVAVDWQSILVVVSILSMFGGNLLAIAQKNIKRMLAYSSIAHIGYTLLGLIAGPDAINGYSAAMFYIATYVIVAMGAFGVITIMSSEGVELDKLEDYRGLNARNPWLAFLMLILMFSMAGIPPTVGFFAKLGLLEALVDANYVWLAVLSLIFAIVGAYYYLRVVMYMYFEEPRAETANVKIAMSGSTLAIVSVNSIAALGFGLLPSSLIDLCRISIV